MTAFLRRAGAVVAAWAVAAAAPACGSEGGTPDKDLGGLVQARRAPAAPDPARATRDADELARALAQPWSVAAKVLGPHRLTVRSAVEVKEGDTLLERLTDLTVLDVDGDRFHGVYENSEDYGREVVFLDGALYQRPRYARWHRRAPESEEEPAATRDQLASTLGDYYALVARGAELSAKAPVQEAGRAGVPVALALAPRARAATRAAVSQRQWRDDARVTAVTGEVIVDQQLGFALRGRVQGAVAFVRDGKPLTMTIEVEHVLTPAAEPITAPEAEQVVATPTRLREVDDRNFLLRGLAPPVGSTAPDPLDGAGAGTAEGTASGTAAGTASGTAGKDAPK